MYGGEGEGKRGGVEVEGFEEEEGGGGEDVWP